PEEITKFIDLFYISQRQMADQQVLKFGLMIIHRIFKWVVDRLHVGIKSEIKTQFTMPYIKLYELKMFVNMCYTDFIEVKESYLRYGGITALFSEYLSNFCSNEGKTSKKKQTARKQSGSVFTPLGIIQMIFERLEQQHHNSNPDKNIHVADISVGYGGFLEKFLLDKNFENRKYSLHGFDADSNKIDIVKLNHALLYKFRFSSIEINNLRIQDSIINPTSIKFDILVGNPPWGANINKTRLLQVEDLSPFAVRQYDSYGLFLVRNILSLKEHGFVYLVLPETILLNPNYKELRKYILENTKILDIIHLGEDIFKGVNMPAIILGVQKEISNPSHEANIYLNANKDTNINEITQPDRSSYILRKQTDFLNNDGFVFDIFTNNEDRKIIEQIDKKSCYRLQNLVDNSRGVEIGKKGDIIQCHHCNVWIPAPVWSLDPQKLTKFAKCNVCKKKIYLNRLKRRDKIILDKQPEPDEDILYSKFLVGENIHKYKLTGNKFIILQRRGIKYKPAKIYKQEKILIRKTSKELLATIDYSNSYTIQVVYQLSLKEEFKSHPFLLEFILGLISSHIMQFYYSKKFQYANRKSFPHHLQKNILSLPIPKIEFSFKQTSYSKFYTQIVFSTLMLMYLTYFEEFHTTYSPLNAKLTIFLKDNPNILENFDLPPKYKENLLHNLDLVKNYPTKFDNLKEIIDIFQKILDSSVERLFLALE
ncbi:MAG: N-6 DNA methylase, partial [Promethearchaeota archaeon]